MLRASAGVSAAAAGALVLVLLTNLLSARERSDWRPSAVQDVQVGALNGSSTVSRIKLAHTGRHYIVLNESQQELR